MYFYQPIYFIRSDIVYLDKVKEERRGCKIYEIEV